MKRQSREERKALRRAAREESRISPYTNGHADFTPFSAITGKEKMSKPTLTNLSQKVNGSFNG